MRISIPKILPYLLLSVLLVAGCALPGPPRASKRSLADSMGGPIVVDERLKLKRVAGDTPSMLPDTTVPREVYIIVHPAYSVFFRDLTKDKYTEAKNNLLQQQFINETKAVAARAAVGAVVVLVLPGKYSTESQNPQGYMAYLNKEFGEYPNVYYVVSEHTSSGTLQMHEMVNLYVMLQALKVDQARAIIGGGYIGRCQREFYNQLTTYLDKSLAFISPEMSTISPEDITDSDAIAMLKSLQQDDFTPVKRFIDKKAGGNANVTAIP